MLHKIFPLICCSFFYPGADTRSGMNTSGLPHITLLSAPNANNSILTLGERDARFPGGTVAWRKYLGQNLDASLPVRRNAPVGRYEVIVQFIIARDGTVTDIRAQTKHGYGMEEEVVRIIKKTPRWIPASKAGQPVNAYRRQPITFVVGKG